MRKALGKMEGYRGSFTATIARIGRKADSRGITSETVLFTDIRDEQGTLVTDHVWFTIGKSLSCVLGNIGKKVSFEARVTTYSKGYKGHGSELLKPKEKDYKLSHPAKVQLIVTGNS